MPPLADDGRARAGAAFSRRRQDLGLTVRGMAARKIVTAKALTDFQAGRTWPQAATRLKLEEAVGWPPGTLSAIREGAEPPADRAPLVTTERTEGESAHVIAAVKSALAVIDAAEAELPPPSDIGFGDQIAAILSDLRQMQTSTLRAMRGGPGSLALLQTVSVLRCRYDALVAQAVTAPSATLGQQLYDARRRVNVGVPEVAAALGLPTMLVSAAEADEPLDSETESRLTAAVRALQEVPIPNRHRRGRPKRG